MSFLPACIMLSHNADEYKKAFGTKSLASKKKMANAGVVFKRQRMYFATEMIGLNRDGNSGILGVAELALTDKDYLET